VHAWFCETPIGLEGIAWKRLDLPAPAAGEVLVKVDAASLNFPDLLMLQNKHQTKPALPFVPGIECAGVIQAVGDGVTTLNPGQRVACLGSTGGFATHALAPARGCMLLPASMSFVNAAAFVITYGTAWHALIDRGQLARGETVLILGAAGGIGTAAIQVAKAAGAHVIAATSSADRNKLCLSLGAQAAINYAIESTPERFRAALEQCTGSKGIDVVVDPIGGSLAETAFRALAWRGRYLVVGFAAGTIPSVPLNLPLLKGASIVGVYHGEFAKREPLANSEMMARLFDWFEEGKVSPLIFRTLPMEEFRTAYALMESREVAGKVVLVNQPVVYS
jgi:NADPH2:quinone reductase